MSSREVVITGLGPVTSIGVGANELWSALQAGRSNVRGREVVVDVQESCELAIASMPPVEDVAGLGEHLAFLETQQAAQYRDLAYTMLAIELALADASLEYDASENNIGVIQAFEAPGVETAVARVFQMAGSPPPTAGPPKLFDLLAPAFYSMQPFVFVHLIGKRFQLHGNSTSLHNACTSGAFAVEAAAQQIRSGAADAMIVAGGEAFETGVRLQWFRNLDLYSKTGEMMPFDPQSPGFFVGEGAAAIVLESAESAESRGAEIYGRYLGGCMAHQGWKQTIPDVRSGRLGKCVQNVMGRANVSPSQIDLVIPHGAATPLSDGYEANCLESALEGQAKRAVATAFKPNFGHLLATSGIAELIAMFLCMKHQEVPATLHSDPTRVRIPVPLVTERTERPVNVALKLSTGFTGHDAAAIFARV